MEDGDDVVDQFPDDFLTLSLPFSEDIVIDAKPISYYLPHQWSSVNFSSIDGGRDDANSPFLSVNTQISENLSLFSQVSENLSDLTLSLFPEVSENLLLQNQLETILPLLLLLLRHPLICLSLPSASSTITTPQCSISSQDSSDFASSSREANASGNFSPKRLLIQELEEEKFVPLRKSRFSLMNNFVGVRNKAFY
ncbi:uncharacterized protein LOC129890734 [Solanum dulcamara]|uniref:uncharacterized protein LOC129890734 n=1 Tax=Solanum dulcamara TaxID=45834 RepID=UPI0024853F82|nr:uncharacterized protein LOC129890734 [Solanum dulcamara]